MNSMSKSPKDAWIEGVRSLDRIWAEGVRDLNLVMEDLPVDGHSVLAREKVRRLDVFSQLLKQLASTSESVRLDMRACVPKLSLSGIPEELILSIFQLACADFSSVVNVSLVCKQFRRIALSSFRLWARCPLTVDMPPCIIDMIVSRSGSAGLVVELDCIGRDLRLPSMSSLTNLFEHSAKWNVINSTFTVAASQTLLTHFPNPDLSALVELVVKDPRSDYDYRRSSFYLEWSLPSLRILNDSTWLPPPSFASKVSNLIECHLSPKQSDLPQLIGFLNAVPGLEKLHLTMRDPGIMNPNARSLRLVLPALRELRLTFTKSWHYWHLEHILPVLLCPGITELALCLANITKETTDRTILECKSGLPYLRSLCPRLKRLLFSLNGLPGEEKLYFIDDILQHLPSTIEHITLSTGYIQLWSYNQDSLLEVSEDSHPCLTSLRMGLDVHYGHEFFPQIAIQLKLRKIKLKELSAVWGMEDYHHTEQIEGVQEIFCEMGVLCDGVHV